MYNNLKKFYPRYSEKEIKNEVENFKKIYKIIVEEIKSKIGNIIDNKQIHNIENNEKELLKLLSKEFPGYNLELIKALKNQIENTSNEIKLDEIINELLEIKSRNSLIRPDYIKKVGVGEEFMKTIKSIGVIYLMKNKGIPIKDKYDNPRENPDIGNHIHNYKDWVGKKLLLTESEIDLLSIDSLENKAMPFLELAINHINKVFDGIKSENKNDLKSIYFEGIHSQEKKLSFFMLFKFYYKLELEKRKIFKKEQQNEYKNHLKQIEIGQFEIQRIIALATLYINRENTLTFQNAEEEQNFLVSKLAELGSEEMKKNYLDSNIESDNLLYNYTKKGQLYRKTKKQNNSKNRKYVISNEEGVGFKKTQLDTFELEGKTRNYRKTKEKIQLLHVGTRIRKNPFSSVEKMLRKGLSSFNEILDHKGFIFVIENYDKDLERLKKVLEYELGTLKTSWLEETESMKIAGNKHTNQEYNSMKGILKVSYKGKIIKDFFDLLGKIINIKTLYNAHSQLQILKNRNIENLDISDFEEIINYIDDKDLFKIYTDLKERFGIKKYFMEVEIQVFDKENYIKAEVDEESPAYHGKYKDVQSLETLPIYFPTEIYEGLTKKILKDDLPKTEKYKYLINNKK
ncbi:MAG: hypothetical protein Q8K30_06495 [Candidatus Gracilibacteria bacterium]|nr:hypothetical protein [Candidatus Gracilibacteria bacterium]